METKIHRADYLKKISVSLETGTSAESMDLSSAPIPLQFIYGAGSQGICPFEKSLFGKSAGHTVLLQVESKNYFDYFGHLLESLKDMLPNEPSFFLKVSIDGVHPADNREVIQAIAHGTGSCDCDCGCGCG
jgi:hypothetical protein